MPARNLFYLLLPDLVKSGKVPVEVVDAALRILRQQVRFSQGRDPKNYSVDVIGCEAHRRVARESAQNSIVLLKNEGDVLPLRGVRRVAVIGRLAATPNTGDQGASDTQPSYVVTPLTGLRAASGAPFTITYDDGSDPERAAAAAKSVGVAICVVGYTFIDEGEYMPESQGKHMEHFPPPPPEVAQMLQASAASLTTGFAKGGDRSSLNLNTADEQLIQAVAGANPRTVVAIMAGSAVIVEPWRDKVAALLMLWYPGMEGGNAFAGVLLGRVNPSGKLPCSFPKRAEDLPFIDKDASSITYDLWHGYRKLERDGVAPAFPFGFGLSYTTFSLADLRLTADRIDREGSVLATVRVTNTGAAAGQEVVQLYIAASGSKVQRAPRELKSFVEVGLEPGECRKVRFAIRARDLAYYDAAHGWIVEQCDYQAIVGRHSLDQESLRATFFVV